MITAQNIEISTNSLLWNLCGNVQFPYSLRRFAQNSAETVRAIKFQHQEIR